jgi:hypothetical protein
MEVTVHQSRIRPTLTAVASSILVALLAGCAVESGATAAPPSDAAAPPSVVATADRPPTGSAATGGEEAAQREWMAVGWMPRAMEEVRDSPAGTSVWLFPPVTQQTATWTAPDGTEGPARQYQSIGPAGSTTALSVYQLPPTHSADLDRAASGLASSTSGRLTSSRPVTIDGHPGLDTRIEVLDSRAPVVSFVRFVDIPGFIVVIKTTGFIRDERIVQQLNDVINARLNLP